MDRLVGPGRPLMRHHDHNEDHAQMKIVSLQTIRPEFQKNLCVVVLTADDGTQGLGEAFFHSAAVEAYLHESVAPVLFSLADPSAERSRQP